MKLTKQFSMQVVGVALTLAIIGCVKETDKGTVNPTFDEKTQTVKTDFVLSVSTNTGKDTKTTAEMAQVGTDAKFLGMENVHLLAYKLDDNNKSADHGYFFFNPVVGGKPVPAERDYDLGMLLTAESVSADQASRSVELALPLGTNAVAFYGKATKLYDNYLQGSTLAEGHVDDMTSLSFSLEPLLTSMDAFDVGAFFFSRMFNYLCCAGLVDENSFWANPTGTEDKSYGIWWPVPSAQDKESLPANPVDQQKVTVGTIEYTYYHGQVSWKQLGKIFFYLTDGVEATDPDAVVKTEKNVPFTNKPLGEALGEAYYVLTTIENAGSYKELRAGSASAVIMTIEDLHAIIERCMNAEATSWEEQVTILLAEEIHSRLERFFVEKNGVLDFVRDENGEYDVALLKTRIEQSTSPTDWSTIKDKVNKLDKNQLIAYLPDVDNGEYGFPVNVGLPFGASIIDCAADMLNQNRIDQFSYVKDIPAYGFEKATFNITNYRYPPELMYYGNSGIRTSVEVKTSGDYPSSVSAWDTESQWTKWSKNAAVSSTTRSVAMINNINYGTALLCSNVKYASGISVLKDNNAALHSGEEDNEISINAGDGFMVTGIIVGGQAEVMGWDYTRRPNGGAYAGMSYNDKDKKFSGTSFDENEFDKMVYDRVIGGYKVGHTTTPIYTMLWDNYNHLKPADEQDDVYIGIELYNNTGVDFWGEMNLVRNKGVFYLLGKMKLADAVAMARDTNEDAFTSLERAYYCYPPFNPANGKTINAPRVFMQDYMTTANLVLNQDCLKHAYVTLPDLRSSQVSLGVSIDMSWEPGLAFDVIMGEVSN